MTRCMDVTELNTVLSGAEGHNVLVVDCRPFLKYNLSHISTAHNIHCPPIVKRRSGGSLPLENIIRCSHTRRDLLTGEVYTAIVVYDDSTDDLDTLAKDSNLALVLKSLTDDSQLQDDVFYLSGGFEQFSRLYPHLTEGSESSSSMDSSTVTTPSSSSLSQSPAAATATDTIRCHPGHDQGDPVEILPYMYLGNAFHAGQEARLAALGISALLNVSCEDVGATAAEPNAPVRTYKRLLVDDNCSSDIGCWFPEAIHFIESAREQQQKVLVHCKAGISRSATICLAYLMWHENWTLEQAYDFLKAKRRLISPNLNFMRQLLEFEQQLQTSREWDMSGGVDREHGESHVRGGNNFAELSKNGLDSAPPRNNAPLHHHPHRGAAPMTLSTTHNVMTPPCSFATTPTPPTTMTTGGFQQLLHPTAAVAAPVSAATATSMIAAATAAATGSTKHHHHHHHHHRSSSSNSSSHCDFGQHPASARPSLSLPLTPCGAQMAVFSFPEMKSHTPSPPQMVCRSPLLSPS